MGRIAILENSIQEYAWGSKTFIPELIGESSPAESPKAEMWMGSHPKAPSMAIYNNNRIPLAELIRRDPSGFLGMPIAEKFSNELPFLFKVIAATKPLSIQSHPDKERAKTNFIREDQKKIPLEAGNRNYRDDNHKPELICALEPLWALKGFRKIEDILNITDKFGASARRLGIDILKSQPNEGGLKNFFMALMNMEEERKRNLLDEIARKIKGFTFSSPAFDWIMRLKREYPGDIGVLSPLFLNVLQLQPGEAVQIPCGELHAYLEGAGLELMANSDNVIRGGLTKKHIDVPELMNILDFTPHTPDTLIPEGNDQLEAFYPVTADEFMLSVVSLNRKDSIYRSPHSRSAEIMICIEGDGYITDQHNKDLLKIHKGTSLFIPAAVEQYLIQGEAIIYKASVPL
ncbi:mannose-6-phosphate isomerase, class I [Deltaproteobacteria bacterium]|nr:mannose-6-phosphate isomerase, class I [Deltaproteobacteria bacterium]